MTWTACVSAVKEAMAGRSLHVMVLLQGIKKLFGPHLDDLDCVSAVKVAMLMFMTGNKHHVTNFWRIFLNLSLTH
jgi:hypothetical protein